MNLVVVSTAPEAVRTFLVHQGHVITTIDTGPISVMDAPLYRDWKAVIEDSEAVVVGLPVGMFLPSIVGLCEKFNKPIFVLYPQAWSGVRESAMIGLAEKAWWMARCLDELGVGLDNYGYIHDAIQAGTSHHGRLEINRTSD